MKLAESMRLKLLSLCVKGMGLALVDDHYLFHEAVGAQSILVDIGANKGKFSICSVNLYGLLSYCVEPDPVCCDAIPSAGRIKKFNVAITGENNTLEFFVSRNREANSFNRNIAERWGIDRTIQVEAVTLTEFIRKQSIPKVDILKMDAEGSEIAIFNSMTDEEIRKVSQITVEFHEFLDSTLLIPTQEVIRRIKELGFVVIKNSRTSYSHMLFLNKKKISLKSSFRFWHFLHRVAL